MQESRIFPRKTSLVLCFKGRLSGSSRKDISSNQGNPPPSAPSPPSSRHPWVLHTPAVWPQKIIPAPGPSDLPLWGPLCWPSMRRTDARSSPAPRPGLPGGLARTGRRHCSQSPAPRPRLHSVQSVRRGGPWARWVLAAALPTQEPLQAGPEARGHCDPRGVGCRGSSFIGAAAQSMGDRSILILKGRVANTKRTAFLTYSFLWAQRRSCQHLTCISLFNPHDSLGAGNVYYPHFTEGKARGREG